MVDRRAPQPTGELGDQFERARALLEGGDRRQKIARVGQPVGADGPEFGQAQRGAIVLPDIAARGAVGERDLEAGAARNERDFAGVKRERAELGGKPQRSLLRHDQQLAVGIVEVARRRIERLAA